jgi:cytochrome bd ubiquinol oxidase subunit I
VAILQTVWHRSGDPQVRRLTRFFGTLLLMNVAIRGGDRASAGVRVRDELVSVFPFRGRRFLAAPLAMEGLATWAAIAPFFMNAAG